MNKQDIRRDGKIRDDLPKQEIVELFRSGSYSIGDLAKRFGCDPNWSIRPILAEVFTADELRSIGRRVGGRKQQKDLPEQEISELFRTGDHSQKDLARKYGCAMDAIRRILSKSFSADEVRSVGFKVGKQKRSGVGNVQHIRLPEDEIVREFLAGKSSAELAPVYGVCANKIKSVLRKHLTREQIKENQYRISSFTKRNSDYRGEKHHLWRGVSSEGELFMPSVEWRDVKREVVARDKVCLRCGGEGRLLAHHIIPRRLDPEKLLWLEPENCFAVCKSCHGAVEPRGWKVIPTFLGVQFFYRGTGVELAADRIYWLLRKFGPVDMQLDRVRILENTSEEEREQ